MTIFDTQYASAPLRDQFLRALDQGDTGPVVRALAADLTACANPLPGLTCEKLGLPHGSTYGAAARTVLQR
jgi:hypothetical protein